MSHAASPYLAGAQHQPETQQTAEEAEPRFTALLNHIVAVLALLCIAISLLLRFGLNTSQPVYDLPLQLVLGTGGTYVVIELIKKVARLEFGSDLLAGVTIVTAVFLGEYLAGAIIVLMFTGGQTLESYAVRHASSVLRALANRMPSVAHLSQPDGVHDIDVAQVRVNDRLVLLPHEICPVDGIVVEGRGVMDESYLTGEPFKIAKAVGAEVLSGAINGDSALTVRATRPPRDSRYAKIATVMEAAQQQRPQMRRLGDSLGSMYTPIALLLAAGAGIIAHDPTRFLAVIVIATPCPLLLGIPVAIIGAISLCAKRAIIIRDPAVLEQACRCETVIFDKTGTLTYGRPELTQQLVSETHRPETVLRLVATLEQYSRHPLAEAVLRKARTEGLALLEASEISEHPGEGLRGKVAGRTVVVTSRSRLAQEATSVPTNLPATSSGLECVIVIDGEYTATYRFHDEPKADGTDFVWHLGPKHNIQKMMLVSGDREQEVRYLAEEFRINSIYAGQTPEQKLEIVKAESARSRTLYIGDGINDAPALLAATVGVAMGASSDVTTNAAGAVVMDNTLSRVDELLHISRRMRTIAMQSALGGMALSVIGMLFAAGGWLTPVAGAVLQEVIDAAAVLNALRAAARPKSLTDY